MLHIDYFNFRNHLTNTVDSSVIQVVSKGAFTAVRTVCVDADTILADAWVIHTLIHILREQKKISTYLKHIQDLHNWPLNSRD